jgi:CRISPR/Cas system CSM-associated protein Csm5 (group 7 of RAMP superfamily)
MNYHITLLSPVHIGTGNTLTPLDFILVDSNFVGMNVKEILLANPQRAEELSLRIAQQPTRFSLTDFLTEPERRNTAFWKYSAALDPATAAILHDELEKGGEPDVGETLKTANTHHPYLPGSSLKGAFRTAWAYAAFRDDEKLLQALLGRLDHVDWRHSDDAVNDLLFWGARRNPSHDLFRALHISDSGPSASMPSIPEVPRQNVSGYLQKNLSSSETLSIGKTKILSLYESRKQERPRQGTMFKQLEALRPTLSTHERSPLKAGWTFLEMVSPGTTLYGEIAIDTQLLQHAHARNTLQWNAQHQQHFSLEALIESANTFAHDACHWERNFFETQVHGIDVAPIVTFYRDLQTEIARASSHQCYLCVGHGVGWHKSTIGLLAEQAHDFNFKKLRKDLRLAPDRLRFPYPKSRTLLMASEATIQGLLGWIRLDLQP